MDFSQIKLNELVTHFVGNKLRNENIQLSQEKTKVSDETIQHLLRYFLFPFKQKEYYSFFHTVDINLNVIYTIIKKIFDSPGNLADQSINIAKHLYEKSVHPKIKGGELYITYFKQCIIDEKIVDAVGIFKSETKETFLKVNQVRGNYSIYHEAGINTNTLDKGCLVFNIDESQGYKVCVVDNINKEEEARYWKTDFLQITPATDEFYYTNNYLTITKTFVTGHLSNEMDIPKTDQIDILNNSICYFKNKDNFNEGDFESTVLKDKGLIERFREYKNDYSKKNNIDIIDEFAISIPAVKKQSRAFKNIIKLDNNFQIHILSANNHIEKGYDEKGNYYKLYYDKEF